MWPLYENKKKQQLFINFGNHWLPYIMYVVLWYGLWPAVVWCNNTFLARMMNSIAFSLAQFYIIYFKVFVKMWIPYCTVKYTILNGLIFNLEKLGLSIFRLWYFDCPNSIFYWFSNIIKEKLRAKYFGNDFFSDLFWFMSIGGMLINNVPNWKLLQKSFFYMCKLFIGINSILTIWYCVKGINVRFLGFMLQTHNLVTPI